jgi:leucyl-tRNA synthetase
MMGMRFEQRLRIVLLCRTCRVADHDPMCPVKLLDEALQKAITYRCEGACNGHVQVTNEDFLQCRACRRKYSTGYISDVEEPERTFLHRIRPDDEWVQVSVFASPGKKRAVYVIDVLVKSLKAQARAWRARRREERATETRAKARKAT